MVLGILLRFWRRITPVAQFLMHWCMGIQWLPGLYIGIVLKICKKGFISPFLCAVKFSLSLPGLCKSGVSEKDG